MVEAQARGLKPQHEGVAVGPAQARQLGMTRWAIGPAGCLTVGVAADREKSATGVLGLSTGRRRTVEMREQEEAQQSS